MITWFGSKVESGAWLPGLGTPKAARPAMAEHVSRRPQSAEPRVEHVVVLMLENRSFDHMFGFLHHDDPKFNGLQAGGYHNVSDDGATIPTTSDGDPTSAAPDHSHAGVLVQLAAFGDVPQNGGFVRNYAASAGPALGPRVMRCLDPDRRLPVLAQLAREFAVCDNWFSSVPGETWPNRNFAHAATSDGATDIEVGLYYDRTVFELLASAGATWRIYHDGLAQAWCFRNLWRQRLTWFDRLRGHTATIANWYLQPAFYEHVDAGDLPAYAFIEPAHLAMPGETRVTNSQHPDNNRQSSADFYAGEELIKSVYGALRGNPAIFEKTLLVITYDEHGGLYDHVPPPPATPPGGRVLRSWTRRVGIATRALLAKLQGRPVPTQESFAFDRLGVRVPGVLVSPWIQSGTVVHTQLEHASIPATLRALFAPHSASLTARDGAANTFHQVVRDHGLVAPRSVAVSVAEASASDGLAPSLGPLDMPSRMGDVEKPPPADGQGPRSKLDQQLVGLGERVREELRHEGPTPAPPSLPTDTRSGSDSIDAPAGVVDEFARAADAARRRSRGEAP